jgi:hypothetical protein
MFAAIPNVLNVGAVACLNYFMFAILVSVTLITHTMSLTIGVMQSVQQHAKGLRTGTSYDCKHAQLLKFEVASLYPRCCTTCVHAFTMRGTIIMHSISQYCTSTPRRLLAVHLCLYTLVCMHETCVT